MWNDLHEEAGSADGGWGRFSLQRVRRTRERPMPTVPGAGFGGDLPRCVGASIRYLVTKPWRIPKLARLAKESTQAANAAAKAAAQALQAR